MSLTEDLISLFHIDSNVRGLRGRLDSAQRSLDAQDRLLAELNQQHEECEVRRRHVRAMVANLEGEIEVLDERLEKLRNELNVATTNKQYTAVLTERNIVKTARAEIEDRVLEEMETIEASGTQLEKIAQDIAERDLGAGVKGTGEKGRRRAVREGLEDYWRHRAIDELRNSAGKLGIDDMQEEQRAADRQRHGLLEDQREA